MDVVSQYYVLCLYKYQTCALLKHRLGRNNCPCSGCNLNQEFFYKQAQYNFMLGR